MAEELLHVIWTLIAGGGLAFAVATQTYNLEGSKLFAGLCGALAGGSLVISLLRTK